MYVGKKGSIIIKTNDTEVTSLPVTFIDDCSIDWKGDQLLDNNEQREITIKFGTIEKSCHVEPNANDVTVKHRDHIFRFPVERYGVSLKLDRQGGNVISIPREEPGKDHIHEIALRDFEKMSFNIVPHGQEIVNDEILVGRSTTWREVPLNFRSDSLPSEQCGDYYSISINRNEYYKFHIYDSMEPKVKDNREGDDLILVYFLPYTDRDKEKHIVFYPAHLQDKNLNSSPASLEKYEYDKQGRCIETLRVKDFYKKEIDWGEGLIYFVARKIRNTNDTSSWELFTSGQYLKPVKNMPVADNLYGLRKAMATGEGKDALTTIKEVMSSDDPTVRSNVAKFIDDLIVTMAPLINAYNYLNSFRNVIRDQRGKLRFTSGYIFMAGWYFQDKIKNGSLTENFKAYWDPLMFGYKYLDLERERVRHAATDTKLSEEAAKAFKNLTNENKLEILRLIDNVVKHYDKRYDDSKYKYECCEEVCVSYMQISEAAHLLVKKGIPLTGRNKTDSRIVKDLYRAWRVDDMNEIYKREGRVFQKFVRKLNALCPREKEVTLREIVEWLRRIGEDNTIPPFLFNAGYDIPTNDKNLLYMYTSKHKFSKNDIERLVKTIGERLHNWRMKPSLDQESQDLREILFQVRKIDIFLKSYNVNVALYDMIASHAFTLWQKESPKRKKWQLETTHNDQKMGR